MFALLAVVLAVYPFFDQSENPETLSGLPWQIEILPDGSTEVFGLHVGSSRLSDAFEILGGDMDLAIIAPSSATLIKVNVPLKFSLYESIGTSLFGIGILNLVEATMYSLFSVINGEP